MNTFTHFNLHPSISKAISVCGYTKPTPVQAQSIPAVLEGKDLVVSAQTGTGKTAAFVLPALHHLSQKEASKKTRILILTPTRELASQITKAAGLYGKFLRFNIVNLVGGMPYHQQIRDLARGADIIVATPGRLLDHMENKRVDLSHVEMLVLDEADRMLDMGFIDDVEYIAKLIPKRQTLCFSATVDKQLTNVVRHLLKNPVRIDLSSEKLAAPLIKQELYKAKNTQHKSRLLKHFLNDENIYKAIIFSATKINADRLAGELRDEGFAAAALHGDLRQNVRNRTIEQLRRGKIQFLVATDVAARGIDISDITHVINFDLPKFCEDYVHRIGRTGRAGKSGTAISFVLPTDMRHVQRIERYLGQRLQLIHDVNIEEGHSNKREPASFERPARQEKSFDHDERRKPHRDHEKKKFAPRRDRDSSYSQDRNDHYKKDFQSKKKFAFRDQDASRSDRDSFHDKDKNEKYKKDFQGKKRFASHDQNASRPDRDGFHDKDKNENHKKDFSSKKKFVSRDQNASRTDRDEKSFSKDNFRGKKKFASRDRHAPKDFLHRSSLKKNAKKDH